MMRRHPTHCFWLLFLCHLPPAAHSIGEWTSEEGSNSNSQQHSYWPPLTESSFADSPPKSSFVQENAPAWSVSYTEPNDGSRTVRPFHRYIFQGVRFARPPDPQTVWQEQLQQLQKDDQSLEKLGKSEISQAIRNYFSLDMPPEKVVKELAGVDLHNLFGAQLDQVIGTTTAAPSWTRPTTPKDKLVQYFERSLDNFLNGRFRAMERIPYLLEKEKLLEAKGNNGSSGNNGTPAELTNPQGKEDDDIHTTESEGSGEALDDEEDNGQLSSISGIPKRMPMIPKVPVDFQEDPPSELVSKLIEMNAKRAAEGELEEEVIRALKDMRRQATAKAKDAVLMESPTNEKKLMVAKSIKEDFQYGAKPSYRQGVVSKLLHFLGVNSPEAGTELDQVLTEWIMDHAPRHLTKQERRAYGGESSYARMQKFLSAPLTPLCTPQPEVLRDFEVDAFMGQWFEVMNSPLMSTMSTCSVISYQMLSRTTFPGSVGSVFQTLQYSSPKRSANDGFQMDSSSSPTSPPLSSGYAIVSRPGQIVFKRSNSPEEIAVHIIDAGYDSDRQSARHRRYEYAILGINCNYPLYVIARDPYIFKQKFERVVMHTLERKGLINDFSRLLNIVSTINPAFCQVPAHFFDTAVAMPK